MFPETYNEFYFALNSISLSALNQETSSAYDFKDGFMSSQFSNNLKNRGQGGFAKFLIGLVPSEIKNELDSRNLAYANYLPSFWNIKSQQKNAILYMTNNLEKATFNYSGLPIGTDTPARRVLFADWYYYSQKMVCPSGSTVSVIPLDDGFHYDSAGNPNVILCSFYNTLDQPELSWANGTPSWFWTNQEKISYKHPNNTVFWN